MKASPSQKELNEFLSTGISTGSIASVRGPRIQNSDTNTNKSNSNHSQRPGSYRLRGNRHRQNGCVSASHHSKTERTIATGRARAGAGADARTGITDSAELHGAQYRQVDP